VGYLPEESKTEQPIAVSVNIPTGHEVPYDVGPHTFGVNGKITDQEQITRIQEAARGLRADRWWAGEDKKKPIVEALGAVLNEINSSGVITNGLPSALFKNRSNDFVLPK